MGFILGKKTNQILLRRKINGGLRAVALGLSRTNFILRRCSGNLTPLAKILNLDFLILAPCPVAHSMTMCESIVRYYSVVVHEYF